MITKVPILICHSSLSFVPTDVVFTWTAACTASRTDLWRYIDKASDLPLWDSCFKLCFVVKSHDDFQLIFVHCFLVSFTSNGMHLGNSWRRFNVQLCGWEWRNTNWLIHRWTNSFDLISQLNKDTANHMLPLYTDYLSLKLSEKLHTP